MDTAGAIVIATLAAVAAACAFGVAMALQHQQAQLAVGGRGPRVSPARLLAGVARRPLWLAAIALTTAAYGLQAIALAFGPLALVAPIVAADLLFALPLAARWSRRRLRARDWAGCLLVAAGVAAFLYTSPPPAGRRDQVPAGDWVLVFGAVAVICVLAVTASKITRGAVRAGVLATAAGVVFGLTAAVTASLTRSLRFDGLASIVSYWQIWALISLGITGLVLSTSAFQAGALSASLPVIDTVEPVSGIIIGAVVFGERLAGSPAGLAVQLFAGAVAATGIALLGPALRAMHRPSASQHGEAGTGGAAVGGTSTGGGKTGGAGTRGEKTGGEKTGRAAARESRSSGAQAKCDLLRVARDTTTAEDCADHLRH